MLIRLKWQSLENRRRHSHLILLFKFVNKMIHIPTQYLPAPSPLTTTRANHNQKLLQLFARTNHYLNIEDLSNCDLDSFKGYLSHC